MNEELMADIQRSLGRIEQKVDTALEWQQTHVDDDKKAFAAIREDIQSLQITRATLKGKRAVLVTLLTAASGGVGGLIESIFHRGH